jgi:hypothetical protein
MNSLKNNHQPSKLILIFYPYPVIIFQFFNKIIFPLSISEIMEKLCILVSMSQPISSTSLYLLQLVLLQQVLNLELYLFFFQVTSSVKGQDITALRASPATSPARPPPPFFSSGWRKTVQLRPRFLVFARIWAFLHPASPGHFRPSGARSGTSDERNARETLRKLPTRHVAPTCRRERAVIVLIASSSAHRRLPVHRLPRAVKAYR